MTRAPESVVVSRLDDELALLDRRTGTYYGLDANGARIFELASKGYDPGRIARELAAEFDAPPPEIERDAAELVAKLLEAGLLVDDGA